MKANKRQCAYCIDRSTCSIIPDIRYDRDRPFRTCAAWRGNTAGQMDVSCSACKWSRDVQENNHLTVERCTNQTDGCENYSLWESKNCYNCGYADVKNKKCFQSSIAQELISLDSSSPYCPGWKPKELEKFYEKNCYTCSYNKGNTCTQKSNTSYKYNLSPIADIQRATTCDHWKAIEKICKEKTCTNCGWRKKNTDECNNPEDCNDLSGWKPITPDSTQQKIDVLFNNFSEFLKEKNIRYGDSALHPIQIFSKASAGSQLCNRLDDKIGRIKNSTELKKNDISDIFGYIALLMIENNWLTFDEFLD